MVGRYRCMGELTSNSSIRRISWISLRCLQVGQIRLRRCRFGERLSREAMLGYMRELVSSVVKYEVLKLYNKVLLH